TGTGTGTGTGAGAKGEDENVCDDCFFFSFFFHLGCRVEAEPAQRREEFLFGYYLLPHLFSSPFWRDHIGGSFHFMSPFPFHLLCTYSLPLPFASACQRFPWSSFGQVWVDIYLSTLNTYTYSACLFTFFPCLYTIRAKTKQTKQYEQRKTFTSDMSVHEMMTAPRS
ncbi:hypothetical protein IWZ01DRAFT_510127, partial [Phyllosticta capitalensis]